MTVITSRVGDRVAPRRRQEQVQTNQERETPRKVISKERSRSTTRLREFRFRNQNAPKNSAMKFSCVLNSIENGSRNQRERK